jgi:FMN phosphatase YigB (HAD superfamily)
VAACAPRALVFDIGRVIVQVDPQRALETLGASAGLSAGQVWAEIKSDPRMHDFQEGRLTPRQWHRHVARHFGLPLSFREFCAAWNSALDGKPILSEDLFVELAARYRLVLLSNTDPIHVAHLEAHFDFLRHFPARVYSCAVGASKPDAAIYRRAILAAGVAPQEILYIDDVADYVEAGRRAGMQVLLFHGAQQLRDELRHSGILP